MLGQRDELFLGRRVASRTRAENYIISNILINTISSLAGRRDALGEIYRFSRQSNGDTQLPTATPGKTNTDFQNSMLWGFHTFHDRGRTFDGRQLIIDAAAVPMGQSYPQKPVQNRYVVSSHHEAPAFFLVHSSKSAIAHADQRERVPHQRRKH